MKIRNPPIDEFRLVSREICDQAFDVVQVLGRSSTEGAPETRCPIRADVFCLSVEHGLENLVMKLYEL